MIKTKNTKRALLLSGLSLCVCIAMLIGSTYAWFTDSVTSNGNIIKSGTLDVNMYWADGTEAPDSTNWEDAANGAIFNNDLWEPGYTEVRHIKIVNNGTLALKYQLSITANGEVSDLADVIDVYYVDPAIQIVDRTDLAASMKLGTLKEALAAISSTAAGNLEAGQNHMVTIALKMQESAGNEYQNKAIGTDFAIKLFATQDTVETDSFDEQYDANAQIPTYVTTAAELQTVSDVGGWAILGNDISCSETININGGVIDGNGHTITATASGRANTLINPTGGTIKNLTIVDPSASYFDNKYTFGSIQFASSTLTEDLYIENVNISGMKFSIDVDANGHSVFVKDCEITNWIEIANAEEVKFEGCHFVTDVASMNPPQSIIFLMGDMTFIDCHFEESVNFYLDSARFSGTVEFENSTYGNNGVEDRPIDSFNFVKYWFPATGVYGYAGTFGDTKPAQTHFNWIIDGEVVWTATAI